MVTGAVAPESKFIKSKAAAKVVGLNVGDRVVAHGKEPTEGKLVADTVEFGATPSAQATKQPTSRK